MDVIVRLPHRQSWKSQVQETFFSPSVDNQTCNYDIEFSNHHPSFSTLRPNWLGHSKMKWWAIHTNIPVHVMDRLSYSRSGDSQNQETFLASSADEQTRNYDIECSNHDPSLLTLRPKGLRHGKMKWWAIHTNNPVDVIVRLPYPRSGESQRQETFLALSTDKPTRNYDKECSNHHPYLSTLRPKRLSRSKMKWWAIYTNLPMDVIVTLPHARSWNSEGQETFHHPLLTSQTATKTYSVQTNIPHYQH